EIVGWTKGRLDQQVGAIARLSHWIDRVGLSRNARRAALAIASWRNPRPPETIAASVLFRPRPLHVMEGRKAVFDRGETILQRRQILPAIDGHHRVDHRGKIRRRHPLHRFLQPGYTMLDLLKCRLQ